MVLILSTEYSSSSSTIIVIVVVAIVANTNSSYILHISYHSISICLIIYIASSGKKNSIIIITIDISDKL